MQQACLRLLRLVAPAECPRQSVTRQCPRCHRGQARLRGSPSAPRRCWLGSSTSWGPGPGCGAGNGSGTPGSPTACRAPRAVGGGQLCTPQTPKGHPTGRGSGNTSRNGVLHTPLGMRSHTHSSGDGERALHTPLGMGTGSHTPLGMGSHTPSGMRTGCYTLGMGTGMGSWTPLATAVGSHHPLGARNGVRALPQRPCHTPPAPLPLTWVCRMYWTAPGTGWVSTAAASSGDSAAEPAGSPRTNLRQGEQSTQSPSPQHLPSLPQ